MSDEPWSKADKLFHRQTKMLEWLRSLGHEIDDPYLMPDSPIDGLTRYLARSKETVKIGNTVIVFDDDDED